MAYIFISKNEDDRLRPNGESRQNVNGEKFFLWYRTVSYGIILKFAVVLMRWSTPHMRANGLRLCVLTLTLLTRSLFCFHEDDGSQIRISDLADLKRPFALLLVW